MTRLIIFDCAIRLCGLPSHIATRDGREHNGHYGAVFEAIHAMRQTLQFALRNKSGSAIFPSNNVSCLLLFFLNTTMHVNPYTSHHHSIRGFSKSGAPTPALLVARAGGLSLTFPNERRRPVRAGGERIMCQSFGFLRALRFAEPNEANRRPRQLLTALAGVCPVTKSQACISN